MVVGDDGTGHRAIIPQSWNFMGSPPPKDPPDARFDADPEADAESKAAIPGLVQCLGPELRSLAPQPLPVSTFLPGNDGGNCEMAERDRA